MIIMQGGTELPLFQKWFSVEALQQHVQNSHPKCASCFDNFYDEDTLVEHQLLKHFYL